MWVIIDGPNQSGRKLSENNGTGLIYWEPSWITSNLCDIWGQGSSYENVAMYNLETNQPLESFSFFDYCGDFVKTNDLIYSSIKIYPNPITKNELSCKYVQKTSTTCLDSY